MAAREAAREERRRAKRYPIDDALLVSEMLEAGETPPLLPAPRPFAVLESAWEEAAAARAGAEKAEAKRVKAEADVSAARTLDGAGSGEPAETETAPPSLEGLEAPACRRGRSSPRGRGIWACRPSRSTTCARR